MQNNVVSYHVIWLIYIYFVFYVILVNRHLCRLVYIHGNRNDVKDTLSKKNESILKHNITIYETFIKYCKVLCCWREHFCLFTDASHSCLDHVGRARIVVTSSNSVAILAEVRR